MDLQEVKNKVEKILSYKTYSQKEKEDALFEIDCNMYTNLGTDSTKDEVDEVHKMSVHIYRQMKKINWQLGSAMLHSLGKLM